MEPIRWDRIHEKLFTCRHSLSVAISLIPKLYFVICKYVMTFHTGVVSDAALKAEDNDLKV